MEGSFIIQLWRPFRPPFLILWFDYRDQPSCTDHRTVVDLFGRVSYMGINRTRPASIRKDMHTGRVFYFPALCLECRLKGSFAPHTGRSNEARLLLRSGCSSIRCRRPRAAGNARHSIVIPEAIRNRPISITEVREFSQFVGHAPTRSRVSAD